MHDPISLVRLAAEAIGLKLPEERQQAVAHALEAALRQAEEVRTSPTPMPAPTAFDAAWSAKK